jgi:hypothetical protein
VEANPVDVVAVSAGAASLANLDHGGSCAVGSGVVLVWCDSIPVTKKKHEHACFFSSLLRAEPLGEKTARMEFF